MTIEAVQAAEAFSAAMGNLAVYLEPQEARCYRHRANVAGRDLIRYGEEFYIITDSIGVEWFWNADTGHLDVFGDDEPDGGYDCESFGDAISELMDGGYLEEAQP